VARTPGETFPDAPTVLKALAATHQIVYLTARDDHFAQITRRFLARHAFPAGPVLYNTWGLIKAEERAQLAPSNHAAFKLAVIKRLKSRGLNVVVGIGNAETDAEAYEAAGLASYIHTEVEGEGKSFRFTTYKALRKKLVADGVLVKEKKKKKKSD
jgi:phosphatidate phosphatase APP1